MEALNYKIQLENFYGPLDLLLHLIRENELDPLKIPVAKVTDQYLTYLEMMQKLDINLAGEFLVMAATLMEIKSRALVPVYADEDEEEAEADPKFELIRRLLEYKKYKDLSVRLRQLLELQSRTFGRPAWRKIESEAPAAGDAQSAPEAAEPEMELDMWQLVKSFAKLSKEISLETPAALIYDDIPIAKIIEAIMDELKQKGELSFRAMMALGKKEPADDSGLRRQRLNTVRNFLATLELARRESIEVAQENDFADIKIRIKEKADNKNVPPSAEPPASPEPEQQSN